MFGNDLAEILRLFVTPAALPEAESKAWRDVRAANDMTELSCDIIGIRAVNDIEIQVSILAGNGKGIGSGVANIKGENGGIINKKSKTALTSGNNEKVMGAVKGLLVLRMVGRVCAVADIKEASLVDAAVGFSKTIDDVIRMHGKTKLKALFRRNISVRRNTIGSRKRCDDGIRLDRVAINIFLNHC